MSEIRAPGAITEALTPVSDASLLNAQLAAIPAGVAIEAPRTFARTATGIGLAVLFLLSFELTARVQDWVRFRMPILSPITSESDLMVRDAFGAHGRPGAQFRKWAMDSLGFRGPEVPAAKEPGTVRIVVTGASETFGLYESPHREFARALEDSLNARLAAGACGGSHLRRFEVLNDALPGMSLPTVEQDIHNRLGRFAPDVIVYYPSPAQFLEDRVPFATPRDTTRGSHDMPGAVRRILHPRTFDIVRDELKNLAPPVLLTWLRRRSAQAEQRRHPAGWQFTHVPRARLDDYEADLRELIGVIRAAGAEPVIATHATAFERPRSDSAALVQAWERYYPRATGSTIIRFDDSARASSIRAASDSGVVVADVAAMFAHADGDNFADFVHFTDAGSARVAEVMTPAALRALQLRHECLP